MNEPVRKTVVNLGEARLGKLMAEKAAAEARLSAADDALKQLCIAYSRAHGFGVNLTIEQVRRDMEARNG
jgi:hypothetical protein